MSANPIPETPSSALWWPLEVLDVRPVAPLPATVHVAATVPKFPSLAPAAASAPNTHSTQEAPPPLTAGEAHAAVAQLARLQQLRRELPKHLPPAVRAALAAKQRAAERSVRHAARSHARDSLPQVFAALLRSVPSLRDLLSSLTRVSSTQHGVAPLRPRAHEHAALALARAAAAAREAAAAAAKHGWLFSVAADSDSEDGSGTDSESDW